MKLKKERIETFLISLIFLAITIPLLFLLYDRQRHKKMIRSIYTANIDALREIDYDLGKSFSANSGDFVTLLGDYATTDTIEVLLEKGWDIDTETEHFHNLLLYSAYKGRSSMVWYLMEQGAAIDNLTIINHNALHYALLKQDYDLARELHSRGLTLNQEACGPIYESWISILEGEKGE